MESKDWQTELRQDPASQTSSCACGVRAVAHEALNKGAGCPFQLWEVQVFLCSERIMNETFSMRKLLGPVTFISVLFSSVDMQAFWKQFLSQWHKSSLFA